MHPLSSLIATFNTDEWQQLVSLQFKDWLTSPQAFFRIYREISDRRGYSVYSGESKRDYRNYYVLDTNPIVVVTSEATADLKAFSRIVRHRTAYFIKLFWWSRETWASMAYERRCFLIHQDEFPQHQVTFLCNSERETHLADRLGLPSIFCNQNCLLDENLYTIREQVTKEFDAIYNARIDPFKRHHLLQGVQSLALIVGPGLANTQERQQYRKLIRLLLKDACVLNDVRKRPLASILDESLRFPFIPPEEVCQHINSSRVGVILSREEGACYASAEYLLCGLPVVSTANMGGRDVFLQNEDYVKYAAPTSHSVRKAIAYLAGIEFDPYYIRSRTLQKMEPHRDRFRNLLQSIYAKERPGFDVHDHWESIFSNRMIAYAQPWPDTFVHQIS